MEIFERPRRIIMEAKNRGRLTAGFCSLLVAACVFLLIKMKKKKTVLGLMIIIINLTVTIIF